VLLHLIAVSGDIRIVSPFTLPLPSSETHDRSSTDFVSNIPAEPEDIHDMHHLRWRALSLAVLTLAPPASAQSPAGPLANQAAPAPTLTAEQWRADLRVMAQEMERRHKNLYHTVSRERFAAAVADLDARIPTLQRNQIIVGMMRIVAMVGDGHTNVSPLKDPKFGFPSLPLKLYLFEDGLHVRAAAPAYAALVGAKVTAIGGVPVEEAVRRAREISPRDNDITPKMYVPVFLGMPDILHALGMSSSRDVAVLTLARGDRRWTASVPAGVVEPSWPSDTDISLVTPTGWVDARSTSQPPLWLQAPLQYHRLVDLPEQKALYAQLNMVTGVEGQTLDQFGQKIRARAEATNPRAVILDLRLNRGGNMDLRFRFIRELIKTEDDDTRLFVLTWRGSFSATQPIIDDLSEYTDAVLIGEPASSKPNSFGDSFRIVLPNSGITVRTSILWHQRNNGNDQWTPVDVAAPLTLADYVAGRDPALEAALRYVPKPTLSEQIVTAARSGGVPEVRNTLTSYLADPSNRYGDVRDQLIVAPQLLANDEKRNEEALYVAQFATERFAKDPDTWSVLAAVGESAGRADVARAAATRTLELDANNRYARSLLERLRAAGK
jgi:hypothetical protein